MKFLNSYDDYTENFYFDFQGVVQNGAIPAALAPSSSSSLVLDNEKGELVRALMKPGAKGVNPEKAMMALRNHSEAERRRRERINGHLTTLRNLIPGTNKMDKAALLSEVINHVKELRKNAAEATEGILVPTDIDEVQVEKLTDGSSGSYISIRASLCCDYKHELLSDLRQALEALSLETLRAEIATFDNRMVNVFVVTGCKKGNAEDTEECELLASSIREALRSVLDKFYASEEFSSRNALSSKRRRVSFFTSSTSSLGEFW